MDDLQRFREFDALMSKLDALDSDSKRYVRDYLQSRLNEEESGRLHFTPVNGTPE